MDEQKIKDVHTARVGNKIYDIIALRNFAETIPVETIKTESLKDAVAEGNAYWLDTNNEMFGPAELLRDWESAKRNPLWVEHMKSVEMADINNPLWVTLDDAGGLFVFDGMHRLTRAFADGAKEIKIRRFKELPEWAEVF